MLAARYTDYFLFFLEKVTTSSNLTQLNFINCAPYGNIIGLSKHSEKLADIVIKSSIKKLEITNCYFKGEPEDIMMTKIKAHNDIKISKWTYFCLHLKSDTEHLDEQFPQGSTTLSHDLICMIGRVYHLVSPDIDCQITD